MYPEGKAEFALPPWLTASERGGTCWTKLKNLFCCSPADSTSEGPVPILRESSRRSKTRPQATAPINSVRIRLSMAEEECISPFNEGRRNFVKPKLDQRRELVNIAQEISKVMQAQDNTAKTGATNVSIPFLNPWGATKRKQGTSEFEMKLNSLDKRMQKLESELYPTPPTDPIPTLETVPSMELRASSSPEGRLESAIPVETTPHKAEGQQQGTQPSPCRKEAAEEQGQQQEGEVGESPQFDLAPPSERDADDEDTDSDEDEVSDDDSDS